VLIGVFALAAVLLPITVPISPHGVVAVAFLCIILAVERRPERERLIAAIGLTVTFLGLVFEMAILQMPSMHTAQVGLVLSFFLAAIALRGSRQSSSHLALGTGLVLALFSWLSLTFGQPFLQDPIGLSSTMICLIVSLGVSLRFADDGFLRLLNSRSRFARVVRWQCLASVLGPWVFGLLLYRVFGVMERVVALEKLMIGATIVGLLFVVYYSSLWSQKEEARRLVDLKKLKAEATTDRLTGLPNRAGIEGCLDLVWNEFQMSGNNAAIIIFDLDHFKAVNDTFGHDGGDLVLRSIRAAVKPVMRSGDHIGRWGGEEFLCVLPGARADQIQMIAERLRAAIESLTDPLSRSLGAPCLISASFGVAQFNVADDDVNCVVKRADEALYASKSSGRNRVSIVGSLTLLPGVVTRNVSTA